MIEAKIDELIAAIDRLTATLGAVEQPEPPKAAKKKQEAKKEKAVEKAAKEEDAPVTLDQVREAAQAFNGENGVQATRAVLEKLGAPNVSAIDPSRYAEALELFQ